MGRTKMPEAEVALYLAIHLLDLPNSHSVASVAIDGAAVRCGKNVISKPREIMEKKGWIAGEKIGSKDWRGEYTKSGKKIVIDSGSGKGDVVLSIGNKTIFAECKGGPVVKKKGNREHPILHEVIGQLITVGKETKADRRIAAVPFSDTFKRLAYKWKDTPLFKKTGIYFALVKKNGEIKWPNGEPF